MGSRPRIPRFYVWTLAALAALFLLTVSSGWILHGIAKARLEEAAGPLDVERFVRPAPPPGSPGARLLAVIASLDVSEADRDLLSETVNGGRSALLANRSRLTALLEKNRESLQSAHSLGPGESWLGIDYRERNWLPRDTYLQISLARMLYLQGLLALEDRNSAGVLDAIRSLGRQAAILENEPGMVIQVFALTIEKYQLRLAVSCLESGLGEPGTPAPASLLVANDLRRRYRDAMVLGAISSQRLLDSLAERSGGWFLTRWTARFMGAGFLDRYRLYYQSYDRDYAWIQRRLSADPGSRRTFQEVWRSGGLDPDVLARYKAVAASRALVRACQAARATCTGGCTLRAADGEEYLRLFGPRERFPAPQTCTLRINSSGSPPRTGPALPDRSPETTTAPSAPAP
jgi:hypothetical protein